MRSRIGYPQCFTAKSTNTLKVSYFQECQRANYLLRQYGLASQNLKAIRLTPSTLSMEASHARTSVLQELEKAWQESEVDFSTKLSDSSKKQARLGCFSKTCQPLELEDLRKSSEHLPIWGMTVGGRVYLPQKLEPVTVEKDGSYLPTIGANEFKGSGRTRYRGSPEFRGAKMAEGLRSRYEDPIYTHPNFAERAMGYPLEWTALKDWATQWFRCKQDKRLKD